MITEGHDPPQSYWVVGDTRVIRFPSYIPDSQKGMGWGAKNLSDVPLRLHYMDQLGVEKQIVYPTFWLGAIIHRSEVEQAMARSYNRWMADVYAESKGRLHWAVVPPLSDLDLTVKEMEFGRKHGAVSVFMRALENFRSPSDPHFDPLYAKAQELNMAVCYHVGDSEPKFRALADHMGFYITAPLQAACFELIASDVHTRFPKLRFGILEGGAGWLPTVIGAAARAARPMTRMKIHGVVTQWVDNAVLREKNIYVACMEDEDLNYLQSCVGSENIVFGTDFGHTDIGSEIDGHRMLVERTDLSRSLTKRVTDDNARALYDLPQARPA
jgi:predicted TIM-barrel fold metal-dependent hydrolase